MLTSSCRHLLAFTILLLGGCVASPFQDEHIATRSTPITLAFFGPDDAPPDMTLEVQCRPHNSLTTWTHIATLQSNESFVVPKRCWAGFGTYAADLRFVSPLYPTPFIVADSHVGSCVEVLGDHPNQTDINLAALCFLGTIARSSTQSSIFADAP